MKIELVLVETANLVWLTDDHESSDKYFFDNVSENTSY